MLKTIEAPYRRGRLEPLEPLALEEGDEVVITARTLNR
jgi:predicted DNA-binding antitoxin AbrB/MazE fold protein